MWGGGGRGRREKLVNKEPSQRRGKKKSMTSGQQTRKLNVSDGREGAMTEGFMRQVQRCGGGQGFQYFPSDSASTTNQTQMRNTNTHAGAFKDFRCVYALRSHTGGLKAALWFTMPTVERGRLSPSRGSSSRGCRSPTYGGMWA